MNKNKNNKRICPNCQGHGEVEYEYNGATHHSVCLKCHGTGFMWQDENAWKKKNGVNTKKGHL